MSKLLPFVVLPLLLLAVVVVAALPGCSDEPDVRTVAVARGTVVRYATATGRIEPRFEVPVTSRNGGLLTRRFVALGQRVAKDEPLFEVRPVVTDRDMLQAELVEISLRSRTVNNATVFDVKLTVAPPPELVLRSGYSAVARIEIERADDVLVLPERVVTYRGDRTFVLVDDGKGGATEREVTAGLSDGLTVEIADGLAEGDEVLERTR